MSENERWALKCGVNPPDKWDRDTTTLSRESLELVRVLPDGEISVPVELIKSMVSTLDSKTRIYPASGYHQTLRALLPPEPPAEAAPSDLTNQEREFIEALRSSKRLIESLRKSQKIQQSTMDMVFGSGGGPPSKHPERCREYGPDPVNGLNTRCPNDKPCADHPGGA